MFKLNQNWSLGFRAIFRNNKVMISLNEHQEQKKNKIIRSQKIFQHMEM